MPNDLNVISTEEPIMENNDLNPDEEEATMTDGSDEAEADVPQTSPDVQPPAVQAQPSAQANTQVDPVEYSPYTITASDNYLANGILEQDIDDFSQSSERFTGYKNLDVIQPFNNGLYVVGAIPGGGKTTLVSQMGYQIATAGHYVLFFSLEQTPLEIFSKFLSRESYLRWAKSSGTGAIYTSRDVRSKKVDIPMLNDLKHKCHEDIQDRIHIFQGDFTGTVEDIIQEVVKFVESKNTNDIVVLIDYLQIISASTVNGRLLDTRSSMDHIVRNLKIMQRKLAIPVVLISSLNRQSYASPLNLESFKESGGIEYTADVVWGLQYDIVHNPSFYYHYDENGNRKKETNQKEKRDMMMAAKSANIRALNITYLKNRFGKDGLTVLFRYVPAYDAFLPVNENGYILS